MLFRKKPDDNLIRQYVSQSESMSFSYAEVGLSQVNDFVPGYDNDLNRVCLGHGEEVYQAACTGLRNWKMFPGGWARIGPEKSPIRKGQTVAMVVHLFGFHWVNGCRIVYTFSGDGPIKKYGFAYGTLPDHIEKGEERFSVEMLSDGSVWYDLRAFSRPRFWMVKLGYPVARYFQKRFVKESQRAMQRAVWENARIRAEEEADYAESP